MRERNPSDWALRSRFVRFVRAGGRCEWCGAVHGQPHPVTGSLVVLTSRASAEAEALRLQKAVPDGQFVVFESTHVTTTIAGPTHMTLSGQALGQQRFAVLCAVDDEVPF